MKKNSQQNNEKSRLAALRSYQVLNAWREPEFDRFALLASLICEAPAAALSLVDEHDVHFKATYGCNFTSVPRNNSFCQYTIQEKGLLYIEDIRKDKRFQHLSENESSYVFYAGYPLIDAQGHALGALCAMDEKPRSLTEAQKKALQVLAEQATAFIAERRSKKEVNSFEKLFNLANDLVCVAGTDGYFKKINPAFTALLGWDEQYLLQHKIEQLVHPDDSERTRIELEKIGGGKACIHFTNRYRTNNDTYVSLEWVSNIDPVSGNIYAIARDVSDEVKKERKLRASEKSFRDFFESSQGLMCTHDLKGNFISINLAGAQILGYTREDLLKKSLYDIIPEERHKGLQLYLDGIVSKGKARGIMQTLHKDGYKKIWLFQNVLEHTADGTPYVIGNATDITQAYYLEEDLKRTKEMMEQSSSLAGVGAWEVNLIKRTVFWSEEVRRIHETTSDFQPDFESTLLFYREGASRDRMLAAVNKAVETGESWDLEVEITTHGGNRRWVRTIGHAAFAKGKCVRIFGAIQDVDHIYLQREELKKAKRTAEDASLAKSEFLANMSHEIRTPLNGIIGFTDLVLKSQLNESQQQYLSIVNQSANALLSIINDILDFSKIEAGKLELNIEKCDLFGVVSEAADVVAFQAQQKGLEVLLNVQHDLPRYVQADALRVKQVLINLLGNAVKFTDSGEVELKIDAVRHIAPHKMQFCFQVRDTGIGIAKEKQQVIYEAFLQEDASTTKKYGGTGLGLAISNKLLGMMGSKLQLNSTPGDGSTFYFDIVLETEADNALPEVNLDVLKRVLIVDDNESNRMIVKQMLLLKDIASQEARNGFEALQFLAMGERYDAILMDYHMPYLNGIETIRQIRDAFKDRAENTPILLLQSSSDDEIITRQCEELQVNKRLVKPIKMQDLYNSLSKLTAAEKAPVEPVTTANITVIDVPLKVMIAEDNRVNMLLAQTIVKRLIPDVSIIEARNGIEAVEKYKSAAPDIILMDIQMPQMNGYEATIKIRQMQKVHTPIIALTAANVKGEREHCLEIGMDDYITKPFVEEALMPVLTQLVRRIKQQPKNHIDIPLLKEMLGDDESFLKELLAVSAAELQKSDSLLVNYAQLGQYNELKATAHKLYGTCVSSGMRELAGLAKKIELLTADEYPHSVTLVENAHDEIQLLLQEVKEYLEPAS
ncbi:PAS domain S-box-containing protein [Filimonas lacunae]|uniref:histidine kinase n=1 Tax=Filimonas lacunae TaxID=477680 RepID=A0A173MI11_9BACT|nr:response regulator [Filimonas lacunae]BAV07139.1 multi-sensor hybrid histidine kinase [Filimonas lacunae]SIS94459.1 PAS domain S-box-containing protein [Filimonas lacunae]